MLIKANRNYRVTTNSHLRFRKYKNLIESMAIVHPEQVWISDITYIGGQGNAYLSLITDAYSKQIMGLRPLSNSLATESLPKALRMANKNRKYRNKPLIHHSDKRL